MYKLIREAFTQILSHLSCCRMFPTMIVVEWFPPCLLWNFFLLVRFCNVSYRACCGISSYKVCYGLVPTSLVGLANNRKSCVQDQEFQNSFPNFQNLVRFILFCSFLGVRRDSFAKITIFVYIFLNLTVDSLVGNKTKLTTRVSWINSFQNLFGELALAGHVSQESPNKFQSFPNILGQWPSILGFGRKHKGNQSF